MRIRALMSMSGRVIAMLSVVALVMVALAPAALGDPPGNNGTVKIDGVPFDDHPDNEPHVGCVFQVDFYGYDEGNLTAEVTFDAQAPTKGGELYSTTIGIGEDPAGGGTDLDASLTVDLSPYLAGIEPHPQQGYHVKLTVNAEGSIGADVKHKVFWITDCKPPKPTTTTTTKPTTTTTKPKPTTTKPSGPGTIVIEKYALPPGDTVFSFTGTLGDFTLVDQESGTGNASSQAVFGDLPAGSYRVSEVVPWGWQLADIACSVEGDHATSRFDVNLSTNTAVIILEPGETVYCDFQNVEVPQT